MQLGVALADRVEVGAVQLGRGDLAALDEAERVLGGETQRVDHDSRTAPVGGTRKASSSTSGAFSNVRSSGHDGRGSSSRQALTTSSGCEVGGTSSSSSSDTFDDRLEDRVELLREALDLLLGEVEPREPRDVQHLSRPIAMSPDPSKKKPAPFRGPAACRIPERG